MGRWRLPRGPLLPCCPHCRNTVERTAEHASSLPSSWAQLPLGPFPCPSSVPGDSSLCPSDDLVEKRPCSWNSSRVCECRAGMFCVTSATNSCARCSLHSVCSAGMIVKFPGKCSHPQPRTQPCAQVWSPSPPDDFQPPRFLLRLLPPRWGCTRHPGPPAAPPLHFVSQAPCQALWNPGDLRHGPGGMRS